ncbi:MAG: NUDIX domain-containing protein [Propionibacteriaceae bacterium]|nr:NUDIX domain-containing protein [Propionibacteriaceae bacterium]
MTGETVALFSPSGEVTGAAPRHEVRARNLWHGATAILVLNSRAEVLVHRRTLSKDVYPGRHDFAVGGVLQAGEDPLASARRELAEEVGITGAVLERLGPPRPYADEHTRYVAFCYEVRWDGPVRAQPEEVETLRWVPLAEVAARLHDPSWHLMPDSVAVLGWRVRELAAQTKTATGRDPSPSGR